MTPQNRPLDSLKTHKILELEFRKKGYWVGLDKHLECYEKPFRDLDISKAKLGNFLHNYRDGAPTSRQETETKSA